MLAFGLLVVFLVLAAQYERWSLPVAVLLSVPFAMLRALVAVFLRGYAQDLYFQIGLLVLVGLSAKNAILIVEFCVALRRSGRSIVDAALEASKLRLRPIIMTSLAFILGVAPLAIASGAGAAHGLLRQAQPHPLRQRRRSRRRARFPRVRNQAVPGDGLVAQSDNQAAGAIYELLRRGRKVPQNVKVTGVDNSPLCDLAYVPLTSVDCNRMTQGALAVDCLLQVPRRER